MFMDSWMYSYLTLKVRAARGVITLSRYLSCWIIRIIIIRITIFRSHIITSAGLSDRIVYESGSLPAYSYSARVLP